MSTETCLRNSDQFVPLKHAARVVGYAVALLVFVVVQTGAAHALTRFVSNYGVDVGTCNPSNAPCRSITYAIGVAVATETIVVGPGIYGDVNGNGLFTDPGDETPSAGCMINVNKRLTIRSRDGAGPTVFNDNSAGHDVVCIEASQTVFGSMLHGFTLAYGNNGLVIKPDASAVRVIGNVAEISAANGFQTLADKTRFIANIATNDTLSGFSDLGFGTLLQAILLATTRSA